MNRKAVIYSRVSTNDQTIENQLQVLREVAEKKGFDWLKWEELTDESAKLHSQLSVHRDIVYHLIKKWG